MQYCQYEPSNSHYKLWVLTSINLLQWSLPARVGVWYPTNLVLWLLLVASKTIITHKQKVSVPHSYGKLLSGNLPPTLYIHIHVELVPNFCKCALTSLLVFCPYISIFCGHGNWNLSLIAKIMGVVGQKWAWFKTFVCITSYSIRYLGLSAHELGNYAVSLKNTRQWILCTSMFNVTIKGKRGWYAWSSINSTCSQSIEYSDAVYPRLPH